MVKTVLLLTVAGQFVICTQFPINLREAEPFPFDEKFCKELVGRKCNHKSQSSMMLHAQQFLLACPLIHSVFLLKFISSKLV